MISVVIPMYNSSQTIVRVLDSIKNQTRIDLVHEIIVVNDGSTDNTLQIVEQYKTNNQNLPLKIVSKKNGGVSSARNLGISLSTQEWIALLDSDDMWHSDKIEKQVNEIKKNNNIVAIGGNRDQEIVRTGKKISDNLYRIDCKSYLKKNWPHTSTLLIKKEVFDKVGMFDETMTHAEDGNLFMRIAYYYGLYYIIDSVENFGDGKLSFGHSGLSKDMKKMHQGVLKMYKNAYNLKFIKLLTYIALCQYEKLKYIRRLIIVKFKN